MQPDAPELVKSWERTHRRNKMQIKNIIKILQERLPLYTSKFSNVNTIIDAVVHPNRITFQTKFPHNLKVQQQCVVSEAENLLQIIEVTGVDSHLIIKTIFDHGLNYESDSYVHIVNGFQGIEARVIAVNSPTSLTIQTNKTLPIGTIYLALEEGFDGSYEVFLVDDDTHFSVRLPKVFTAPHLLAGKCDLFSSLRVMGVGDMDRFNDLYTEQAIDQLWLAITPPENRASRDRSVVTDAISGYMEPSSYSSQTEIRQLHTETVSLYCAIPARATMDGRNAIDIAEEVRFDLYQALCGIYFPSLAVTEEIYPLMPVRDGYFSYLSDNTTYIHEYVFERSIVLTNHDIGTPKDRTAPVRDLELSIEPCDDTERK